jgi:hypothetical protein
MAGEERHPPPPDLAERQWGGRRSVGRVERDLLDVVEQRVQAGAAVDADLGARAAPPSEGAHAVLLAAAVELDESPPALLPVEVSDEVEPPSDEPPAEEPDEPPADEPAVEDDADDEDDRLSFL